ncbi:MAG: peptidase T [Anaerolineae bacterium]|nr:peptidase T [Anaerolineae bacterium]
MACYSLDDTRIRELEQRFLRYARIDTQSDEAAASVPSTEKQWDLLRLLQQELQALGAMDVMLTDYGCLFATAPATIANEGAKTVAFLAHVDTAPAFNGAHVMPIVHRQYDGKPLVLPDDPTQVLTIENDPLLKDKLGEDIITASGATLLGADDKSGIAVIMTLVDYLLSHPEIPHGAVRLCFTVDEEIGKGVTHLDLGTLAADVAYTLDGGEAGEVTYETFSGDRAVVKIKGVSTHTGTAKGKMVNALNLAAKLIDRLPQNSATPETTEGREGFIHVYRAHGSAAEAEVHFILRDFELEGLRAHGQRVCEAAQQLQREEPRATITCTITPQYRNMRYWLEKDMLPVELAMQAIEQCGLRPIIRPIRGGTDGAGLTERGLPTPNLFTGMQNSHGPLEWISVQDMVKSVQVCLELVQLWAEGVH